MKEDKKKSTEYIEEEKKDTSENFNRKNVNYIKRIIIVVFVVMCVLPILLCLYLLVRMNSMERKLDDIMLRISVVDASNVTNVPEVNQDENTEEQIEATSGDADKEETETIQLEEYSNYELNINQESESQDDATDEPTSTEEEVILNGKKVYLTFDDGPSPYTGEILDILKANNVKATFFVVHKKEEELWTYYNRIVDEGHTLAMHSYTHVYSSIYASKEAFVEDVSAIHDFLYEQTGYDCKYYRFPGGSSNSVSGGMMQEYMSYLDEEGITYFDWNALSGDAAKTSLSGAALNNTILSYVRNNPEDSIVLMHDLYGCYGTVEGLQDLIDTLKEEGYELCAIDDDTKLVQHITYKPQD